MRTTPIARLPSDIQPVSCPCGESRRIITADDDAVIGFHVTSIEGAQAHFHRHTTEVYYVLDGSGSLILDGAAHQISPGSVAFIPPGCAHRGEGSFTAAIAVLPPFDPEDEYAIEEVPPGREQQPIIRHLSEVEPQRSPCGSSRRVLTRDDGVAIGAHVVSINAAESHYHKRTTEIYHVLEGEGVLRVGEKSCDLEPGLTVYVPSGMPHGGEGQFTALVIIVPPFDPDDQIVV